MKGSERSLLGPAGAKKPWAKPSLTPLREMVSIGTGAKAVTQESYEGATPGASYPQYGPVQDLTPTSPGS